MRLRALYALNGVVWGLLVGMSLGIELFALAAGFSWIYLFGDDAWPDIAAWYLTAAPLIGALAGLGVCVGLGTAYGRRREEADQPEAARRLGRLILFTGLAAWLLIGGTAVFLDRQQRAARQLAVGREAALTHLMTTRRVVAGVVPSTLPDGRVQLRIETVGTRNGAYRLTWRLRDPLYRTVLAEGEEDLDLTFAESALDIELDRQAVARRYREANLNETPGRVLIDQDFTLQLILEPRLDEAERAALPPREIGNLARGLSDLRFETRAEVPMRFEISTGAGQ